MKKHDDLHEGERIEIIIDNDKHQEVYVSKIEEVIDRVTLIIASPISGKYFTYFSVGQEIKIVFFRDESAYAFNARVIDRIKYNNSVSAVVNAISKTHKVQRRNYFRLGVMVDMTISYKVGYNSVIKHLDAVDISGGGIKIMSAEKISLGTDVQINMNIPGIKGSIINGRVVRCAPSIKNSSIYDIGIEFVDISANCRQKIIQYIFARQRKILRRGLKEQIKNP